MHCNPIIIQNYLTDHYLILGCDGHAFIKSSDFDYHCLEETPFELAFESNLNLILDTALYFYKVFTNNAGNDVV